MLALSALLHGVGVGSAGRLAKERYPLPSTQQSMDLNPPEPERENMPQVEPRPISEIEKHRLLQGLLAEKQSFIGQLLKDLRRGQRAISMSDFMIKSQVIDRNIKSLEAGSSDLISEAPLQDKFRSKLAVAKREIDKFEGREDRLDALRHYAHRRVFRGYLKGSSEIIDVIQKGIYNCTSSTEFLTALEDSLNGANDYGPILLDPPKDPTKGKSGHMLSWFNDGTHLWQIENTDGGVPRRKFEAGLRVPKDIFIAAYLVRNGVKVSELPNRLARLYSRGINANGFPVAGESTDLPDPSDDFKPNPHFQPEIKEIIKEARVMATVISFSQEPDTPPFDAMGLNLFKIPEGINWCDVAQDAVNSHSRLWGELPGSFLEVAQDYYGVSTIWGSYPILVQATYSTAVGIAGLMVAKNKEFEACTPENELKKLDEYVGILLNKGSYTGPFEFLRALAIPEKGREAMLKIYRSENIDQKMKLEAYLMLVYAASSKDIGLFKEELFYSLDETIRTYSSHALSRMGKRNAQAIIDILYPLFQKEKDRSIEFSLARSLGRINYGGPALIILGEASGYKYENEWAEKGWKRLISNDISKIQPSGNPTPDEIEKLKGIIEKEDDPVTKAILISVLFANGKPEEALLYAEKYIFRLLLNKDTPEANMLVLAIGKIDSPRVRETLLAALNINPQLAVEIGDVFFRQDYRSDEIIAALKKVLNDAGDETPENPGEPVGRRTYAALLLILMNELPTSLSQ
ncbi:MAG: hypothetical protein WC624_02700 [Candidatus Margulisiibacteriota bacterium]